METLNNPHRGQGLPDLSGLEPGTVRRDTSAARRLIERCPAASRTPLLNRPDMAQALGVAGVSLKDERTRLNLGSFKALGAAYVLARDAAARMDAAPAGNVPANSALQGRNYICASAGNHGLSLAAAAQVFGAKAVIVLCHDVPESFVARLEALGARVIRAGDDYEQSARAAASMADDEGWTLVSDVAGPGVVEIPTLVMEGYLVLAAEIVEQIQEPPTHILLQAGAGGFAAAVAAHLRASWGDAPTIVIVEPAAAPALHDCVRAGRLTESSGPASIMGRLDCKTPSHLALVELAREADHFALIEDHEAEAAVTWLKQFDIATSPSGAAGIAAANCAGAASALWGLNADSRILAVITEIPAA